VSPHRDRRSVKARAHPELVLTSLSHHRADIDHVRTGYQWLKGNKAVGIDAVTTAMYANDLEANLHDGSACLTRMGYHPQPKLRVYIPQPGSEQGRPLGMSRFEDQIVALGPNGCWSRYASRYAKPGALAPVPGAVRTSVSMHGDEPSSKSG
jgi:hypothetical protein